MSLVIPASSNAFLSSGRSLFSQRAEDLVSGRMTPTLPEPPAAAEEEPAGAALEAGAEEDPPLELLLQAASARADAAIAVATNTERLRIVETCSFRRRSLGDRCQGGAGFADPLKGGAEPTSRKCWRPQLMYVLAGQQGP